MHVSLFCYNYKIHVTLIYATRFKLISKKISNLKRLLKLYFSNLKKNIGWHAVVVEGAMISATVASSNPSECIPSASGKAPCRSRRCGQCCNSCKVV